jgi:amino acid adenylation domain-containing protein
MIYLVQHLLERAARRLPKKVALVYGGERVTYSALDEDSNRLATALVKRGVLRQDRILVLLDNSVASVISFFGCLKAGAIPILLSATIKPLKFQYILENSAAVALISQHNKRRVIEEAVAGSRHLRQLVWVDRSTQEALQTGVIDQEDWKNLMAEEQANRKPEAVGIDCDLATIIYTSGSTGEPKGVMSSHHNVLSAVGSIVSYLGLRQDDRIFCALPLSFDYGLYQVLMAFKVGSTVILEKSFAYPFRALETMVKEGVTVFPLVPTMAALIMELEDLRNLILPPLRLITNTAAAFPSAYSLKLQEIFPSTAIFSMYGLTECKRVSYLPPELLAQKPNSVGKPMPNVEIFILAEDGKECPTGCTGELVVRGANVMQGYWNAPKETAKRFKPGRLPGERLLYTGDLITKDADGHLYFVGRNDDMIKTKGERVSPKEIENCLCAIPGILEAAVIGVPDPIWGQSIKAFVRVFAGNGLSIDQVLKHCKHNLESFMVPKDVVFVNRLPKGNTGKIDKKQLR